MCCGKFDFADAELQALRMSEKRTHRIGRRPLLKGLGVMGLLSTLGFSWPSAPHRTAHIQVPIRSALRGCFQKYKNCRESGESDLHCDIVLDCCLEKIFPPDIKAGDLVNPFCDEGLEGSLVDPFLMSQVLNSPGIRESLDPLNQLMKSGQPLPIDQSGFVLLGAFDAHFEAHHRLGQAIRDRQASGGLGVEISAEAKQTCGSQFSHSMLVTWRVYGGRPPVQIGIEITDPSGKVQKLAGAASEGMAKFELNFPGGGSASVVVTAKDSSNSNASAQSSVQLGRCQ